MFSVHTFWCERRESEWIQIFHPDEKAPVTEHRQRQQDAGRKLMPGHCISRWSGV